MAHGVEIGVCFDRQRRETDLRLKKEEEERQARRRRVEAIMLRTRTKGGTPSGTPTKVGTPHTTPHSEFDTSCASSLLQERLYVRPKPSTLWHETKTKVGRLLQENGDVDREPSEGSPTSAATSSQPSNGHSNGVDNVSV